MKKTLITLLALGGVALGAQITEGPLTLNLPDTVKLTDQSGAMGASWSDVLNNVKDEEYGIYFGGRGSYEITVGTTEGQWTKADNGTGSIVMCGRYYSGGEALALVLGSEIVAGDGSLVSSVTLSAESFSARTNMNAPITLGVGIIDASGNVIYSAGGASFTNKVVGNKNSQTVTVDGDYLIWQEGYKIVAVITGDTGGSTSFGSTDYTIGNIAVVANLVPEPATATLSLLALAGLAARRRRNR